MKNRLKTLLKISTLAAVAALLILIQQSKIGQASNQSVTPHDLTSNADDQGEVSVTAYNSNIGLVRERRQIRLKTGVTALKFTDVAAQIMPQTVHIKSLTSPAALDVLEQNYEYDLLTPQKLLDKFVGQEIKVLKDGVEVPITILSTNNGVVYRMGDRIFTDFPGKLVFPKLPENLMSKPTLVWLLDNQLDAPQQVEATYLTQGINWKADYVTVLDQDDQKMDLTGWVTLVNQSGATYRNARLKLVAGDVNRVIDQYGLAGALRVMERAESKPASAFAEQSFFEYHLYSLQRPTTIKENQTKQVSLLTADQVPVTKRFLYYGAQQYYRSQYGAPLSNQKVGVYVEITNTKAHRLGMPLPKGTVRVYKADKDGSLQFVGEDAIDHTPKDETIKIKMGEAFDIVAERKQTDWRKISSDTYEVAFEVKLRNHKESPITVSVIEPIPGDWEILKASHEHKNIEAHTVQFDVPVNKDQEATLQYRVRLTF
jgi:hypothetical protein